MQHVLTIDNSDDERLRSTIGSDSSVAVRFNMIDTT